MHVRVCVRQVLWESGRVVSALPTHSFTSTSCLLDGSPALNWAYSGSEFCGPDVILHALLKKKNANLQI